MQSVERTTSNERRIGSRRLLAAILAVVAVATLRADDFTDVLRIPEVSTDEELLNNIPTAGPLVLEDPRAKQPLLMVPEDEVQLLPVAVPEKTKNTTSAKSQNDGWNSTDFPSLPGDPAPLPRFDDELKLVGFNGSATAVSTEPQAPTPIQSQPMPVHFQPLEQAPLRIEAPLPSLPGDNDLLLAPVQATSPGRPESGPIIEPTPSPTPNTAPSPPPRGGTQFTPPNIPMPTPNIPVPEPGPTPTPTPTPVPTPTPTPTPEPSSPAQGGASNLVQQIASRVTPAAISNPAAPSSTVQAASVATPAPASTGEIIERAISVSVRRTSPTNIDAKIRGFNTHQVTATADGMPQPKTRVDIDSYFSQIPAGLVENITVLDGPYSSLYGQGFGFFIAELFPTRQYDSPEFHGKLSMSQDTNAKTFYQRETAWGGGQNWSFVSSYGLRTASDYRSGGNFLVPAQYQTWDGFGALALRLTERSRLEVQYLHPELNNMELPGVAYDLSNSTNTQANVRYIVQDSPDEPIRLMIQYWYGYTGYGGNALRPSKQITFFQPFLANTFSSFLPAPLTNLEATGSLISQGLRGLLTFGDKDETLLTVGADWRQIRNDFVQTAFLIDDSVPFTGQFGIPAAGTNDAGVLMNVTMPWSDRLNLTLGARGDIYTASLDPTSVAVTQSPFYGSLVGFTQPSQVLGMVYGNAEYQVNDEVSTISGFGIAMRGPDATELYSSGPFSPIYRFGNSGAFGNSDLQPEINIQFDLGANARYDNANFGFRSYIANIFDYILAVPYTQADGSAGFGGNGSYSYGRAIQNGTAIQDTTALDYKYQNVTRASLMGCDFMGDYKINEWFSLAGRTSYTKGTNHDVRFYQVNGANDTIVVSGRKGSAEGLPGIYPWNGVIALRVHEPTEEEGAPSRWGGDIHTRMVMGQNFVARSLGEVPSDGFTTLGIRAFWRPNQNLRFTLSVENLLNRNYAEIDSLAIFNPALGANGFVFVPEQGIYALFGMEASF